MHLQLFLVRLESMAFGYLLSQPFGMLVTFSSLNGNLSVSTDYNFSLCRVRTNTKFGD